MRRLKHFGRDAQRRSRVVDNHRSIHVSRWNPVEHSFEEVGSIHVRKENGYLIHGVTIAGIVPSFENSSQTALCSACQSGLRLGL